MSPIQGQKVSESDVESLHSQKMSSFSMSRAGSTGNLSIHAAFGSSYSINSMLSPSTLNQDLHRLQIDTNPEGFWGLSSMPLSPSVSRNGEILTCSKTLSSIKLNVDRWYNIQSTIDMVNKRRAATGSIHLRIEIKVWLLLHCPIV